MSYDKKLIDEVKGFMDEDEGRRLYEVAKKAGELGPCLEIGSYCGKSTIYFGAGVKESGGVLFSIDHHRGSEEQQPGEEYFDPDLFDEKTGKIDTFRFFRQTIDAAGLENTVIPMVGTSRIIAKMWATPLSMVFIDGGHTFEAAYNDYNSWLHHVMPGGYLVVHDIFKNPEEGGQAPYYVYKKAIASGLFKELPMTKTLGVLQRYECGELPGDLPVF